MAVSRILELLSHKELYPEIQLLLQFIAENCQRLATILTSLEQNLPLAYTVYNTLEDLKSYLQAGITKTSFGPQTDRMLDKLSVSAKRKHVQKFHEVFRLSFDKLNGHLTNHPVYQYYGAVRIFDPRQLPTLQHDIQPYGQHIKQLDKPSHQLLEEWLIYSRYKEVAPPLAELEAFWTSMTGRFPLLSKIALRSIWMPVTSVSVERSFSQYKHLLNDRRERLTEENTRRLMMLYYNGDIEQRF